MKITLKTCISDPNDRFTLTLSADFRDNQELISRNAFLVFYAHFA